MAEHITSKDFDAKVLKSATPVLVDFYAEWCGPCKMLSPVIDEVANEYQGKCAVYKVNVDEEQELASKFRVASIPTLVFFKNGQPVETSMGAVPKTALVEKINKLL